MDRQTKSALARGVSRGLRNRLALTTILTVAPFIGYGRQAFANCDPTGPSTYSCSLASGAQTISANNAYVSTVAGFSVNTATDNGITITGDGHLQYVDTNASPVTSTNDDGLYVRATGDAGPTDGAITINTNGNITGGFRGIYARNDGGGDISITSNGEVEGQGAVHGDGIYALNYGTDVAVVTGLGSSTTGADEGIDVVNQGSGNLVITAHGGVEGANDGILAYNSTNGVDLTVTAHSTVKAGGTGIYADNQGSGALAVTANGGVTAYGSDGIYARNYGTSLTITTGVGSAISGADDGIDGVNLGTGSLTITANGGVGGVNDGIVAFNSADGLDLTITTGAQSFVSGIGNGINAENEGSGNLSVTANGKVVGYGTDGIFASNSSNGANLKVTTGSASDVTGFGDGIEALNDGAGGLTIIANGAVTGQTEDGIYARNGGTYLKIENAAGRQVLGASDGMDAENDGSGDLIITAHGTVTGTAGNGIEADNLGGNLTIRTGAGSIITGGEYGIETDNDGDGDLIIRAYGKVTGQSYDGIFANNDNGANNLEVTTGAASVVTGSRHGINALNEGNGDADIAANGEVVGSNEAGLKAYNSANGGHLEITTGTNSTTRGYTYGIHAENKGSGDLTITTNGIVTALEFDGIFAVSDGPGEAKITIGAQSDVTGERHGINLENRGDGDSEITVNGILTGTEGHGINAISSTGGPPNSTGIKIVTAASSSVTGAVIGIGARNSNNGDVEITVNGMATGLDGSGVYGSSQGSGRTIIKVGATGLAQGIQGIFASTNSVQGNLITNDGTVRTLSGDSSATAIVTDRGATTINNNNFLLGTVLLGLKLSFDDTLNNAGLWNSANGFNEFGGGHDVVNNSGTLRAADDPALPEETSFSNLEVFNNSGLMTLVDGREGDTLQIIGAGTGYVGLNGKFAVDAFLDPLGKADRLLIIGNSSGTTNLLVNLTNPIGSSPNFDGIPVITVIGANAADDFKLEGGVLNAGFFAWNLKLEGDIYYLYTTGLGAGSYEFAAGITGARDLWYQTTGTLLQRQADLHALLAGTQVTPVADFSEPVEPTPVGHVTPGLWFRAVGGYLERDQDVGNNAVTDRNQEIYGLYAGFDSGTENLREQGDALMFGLFGGYVTSNLDFTSTNTKWDYEGPSVGAYATYLDHAFYADLMVKADFLDVDIDASGIAPAADDVDTDVLNLGGQIDTGYKVPLVRGLFVEPQATLAVVHTEIDDIDDIFGGAVDFEDETSVRGRLGLRLGHEFTAGNQLIYSSDVTASVWEEFAGDNEVTVAAPLFAATTVADDPGETFGDVSLGFSVLSPEGWSSFLRANYQFSQDYDAFAGNAGLRFTW